MQNTKQKVISLEKTRSKQKNTEKKSRRKFRAFYYWKFISFPIRQFLQFAAIKCSLHINIYFICRCTNIFRAFVCWATQKWFNFKIVLPWFVLSCGKILFIMKMDLLHENVYELLSGLWIIFNKWFRGNDYWMEQIYILFD